MKLILLKILKYTHDHLQRTKYLLKFPTNNQTTIKLNTKKRKIKSKEVIKEKISYPFALLKMIKT